MKLSTLSIAFFAGWGFAAGMACVWIFCLGVGAVAARADRRAKRAFAVWQRQSRIRAQADKKLQQHWR